MDLSFRRLKSLGHDPRIYYIDCSMLVWNSAPSFVEPKSAIVSEGMGTGKTCICLALILTTRHHLAEIDRDREHANSFHLSSIRSGRHENFPWAQEANSKDINESSITRFSETAASPSAIHPVPSLHDLTLDILFCSRHPRQLEKQSDDYHIPTNQDQDLPYIWEIPPSKGREATRSYARQRKKVYISAATLVIVPDILVAQWVAEIQKHVKEGFLDYVKLDKHDPMPDAARLCRLDLVLLSESKVRSEAEGAKGWMTGE